MRFFHRPCAFWKNLMMSWTTLNLVKVCHALCTVVAAVRAARAVAWAALAIE